jgi:D-serine deaminase-like pyridoxal phosphate-dependent protein
MINKIGTHLKDIETPELIIDLDILESNVNIVSKSYKDSHLKMRAHTKNLKSPYLARKQVEAGGSNGGVCTAKVSEAEVMVEGGFDNILIANQVVSDDKIERLCSLAKFADMKVGIDNIDNLNNLSKFAIKHNVVLGVLVEINTSMFRCGVRSSEHAVALAKHAIELEGIDFKGVMSHQSIKGLPAEDERWKVGEGYLEICLESKRAIEESGIDVEIVSTGETFTFDIALKYPEITEIQEGTYALMDLNYPYMPFDIAVKVFSTIIDIEDDKITIDAGNKCIAAPNNATPLIEGVKSELVEMGLDYSIHKISDNKKYTIGDKVYLLTTHEDGLMNR